MKGNVASASSGGPGNATRAAFANAYAAIGSVTMPETVTSLKAMLYGTGTSITPMNTAAIQIAVRIHGSVNRRRSRTTPYTNPASRKGLSQIGGPTETHSTRSDGTTM